MVFKIERSFNFPYQESVNLLMDTEGGGYDMQELDNVTAWKVVREEEKDNVRTATKEWCAHAQIPKTLQAVITPKMLTWYEHSRWERANGIYKFEIEPFYLKEQIKVHGQTHFFPKGESQFGRTFEINVNIKIPILGPMAEKLVLDLLKTNEKGDYEKCVETLARKLAKK